MKKLLLALLATTAVAGVAQAQTVTNTAPHAYVGIGAATANNKTTDDYKTNAKVYGGYELGNNWGVEAGYTNFDKENSGIGNVKGSGTYVAGKYTVPLGERFSGYGKLGVSYNERKYSDSLGSRVNRYDTGLYGGVGVAYALNQNVSLNAEYERYGKDKDFGAKADVYTVGLNYGF